MNQALYLVVGLGKTGHSIAGYLQRRNLPFVVYDTREQPPDREEFSRQFPGVDVFFGDFPIELYSQLTEIVVSPGVALDALFIQEAQRFGIPIVGDIECLAREITAPAIAITGTNGKSTVTTLLGEMAKEAGLSVAVAGNIGMPVLDLLDDGQHYDLWVLELSSFQLDLVYSLKPRAATILNVSPDHLDRHHSLAGYVAAKQRIYLQAHTLIYNRDDIETFPFEQPRVSPANTTSFGLNPATGMDWGIVSQQGKQYLARGSQSMMAVEQLRIKGKHNWQNALAACALAEAAGIEFRHVQAVLQSFPGLAHRCQWVRTLDGVEWINDSKGTNIGATISAIAGIGGNLLGKIVLIAGGLGKGADFTELRPSVSAYVRSLVLIGTDADKIEQALSDIAPTVRANSFEEAILQARSEAKPGDVVLLSPACASLDMFRDFNHRGESFANLVEAL